MNISLLCHFLKDIFDVDCFLKSFWICCSIASVAYVLVFWPKGMWVFSSLTRGRTPTPCSGRGSLSHWTSRESLPSFLKDVFGGIEFWVDTFLFSSDVWETLFIIQLSSSLFFSPQYKVSRGSQVAQWVKESACQCRRCWFDPWVGKIPHMRAWRPTPVLLPGESHGQRSLVGCSPWGCKESDMTEATEHAHTREVSGNLYCSPACNSCFSLPAFKVFS